MFCRCLYQRNCQKVGKLIGLDPAAASQWMDKRQYIQKGDALYVQSIQSSKVGTNAKYSDGDISLRHNCGQWNLHNNHRLAAYLHEIIAAKKAIFIATEKGKGKGRVINLKRNPKQNVVIANDESIIGVYNRNVSLDADTGKRYEITIQWDDCKTVEKIRLETKV